MESTLKTKIEIIKETIEFYGSDPSRRALDNGLCQYKANNGNKCAFGRCMKDEFVLAYSNDSKGAFKMLFIYGINILKEEYQIPQEQSWDFWDDIQEFHDTSSNFESRNLSELGKNKAKFLIEKYK